MNKELVVETLKKNAVSVTCGVVALAAVVAAFYPLGGMNDDLKTQSTERAGKFETLNGLLTKQRTLPILDPGSAGTPPPAETLKVFPNKAVIDQGTAQVTKLTGQSTGVLAALYGQNGGHPHEPLVPSVLPQASSDYPKIEYREVYKLVLSPDPFVSGRPDADKLPHPPQADPANPNPVATNERLARVHALNLATDVLEAGQPPSADLIRARTEWVKTNVFDIQVVQLNGAATNRESVLKKFNERAAKIPAEMNAEVARLRKVYLDPDAFAVNAAVAGSNAAGGGANIPAMTDIWYSQMALWVQQDVSFAVADLNRASANVLESPVKRIVRLQLNAENATMYLCPAPKASDGGGGSPAGGTGLVPGAETETTKITASYDKSPTGRTSNAMYDVIPFTLVIDVDAEQVNQVIQTLCGNRLVTVTGEDLRSVDSATFAAAGFLYGAKPVVRLTLTCEELFLRKSTIDLMPPEVKLQLGITATPAGGTGVSTGVPVAVPAAPPRSPGGGGGLHIGS